MKLEPLIQMPVAWTGFWGGLGVHLFQGQVTLADMDRLDAFSVQWHRKNPGKLVEMSVIFPSESRMSREERTRMAQIIKRWEHERLASATVILAQGMLGAMHRSVLTGLLMLAPPPHPTAVFGAIADAATWLWPHLRALAGFDATPAEVVAAVAELSAAFQAQRGAQQGPRSRRG
jgi:hypothetical protein